MRKIAILLTVYNRKDTTLKCLRVLLAQHIPHGYELDIYLLNDGCTDGTPEAVKKEFPSISIVDSEGDLYWNNGMIKIWEFASSKQDYDFYLWLNDDTILNGGCIETLLKTSLLLNDSSIVVGTTCDELNPDIYTYGGRNTMRNVLKPDDDKALPCKFINGNIVLVPKSVYLILGTNDPYYFHSRGDFDYGLRALEKGIGVFVAPGTLGQCNRHDYTAKWIDPNVPLKLRLKLYFSPKGFNAKQDIQFNIRHFGFYYAIIRLLQNLIHVLFPKASIIVLLRNRVINSVD